MDVSHLRNEFAVFVVAENPDQRQFLSETVRSAGYPELQTFATIETALSEARENPPHLVIFSPSHGGNAEPNTSSTTHSNEPAEKRPEVNPEKSESFLVDLQGISSEILTYLHIHNESFTRGLQWVSRGLAYDLILRPLNATAELIQKLDRGAERLYFQFESEQLREHLSASLLKSLGKPAASAEVATNVANHVANHVESDVRLISESLAKMSSTKELDQCIQFFMEALSVRFPETPILYLKFVPSHLSLLVAQSMKLPIEKIRGIGVDLKKEDPARVTEMLKNPSEMEPLRRLMQQVFRREELTAFSHDCQGETMGLFVLLDRVNVETDLPIMCLRRIFDLTYERNLITKEKHALDTVDPTTGLVNRRHFGQRVDEEISRARRILLPVSVISIDIDGFKKLNSRIGFRQADSVLKMVAMILKKTARVTDILARTGPDEIILLMPHTPHMGAAIKAERLRRMIESTRFPLIEGLGEGPLTVSCGISEYPSFCNDADSLLRSADDALMQVKKTGGNKVCLTSPPPGFQIDFVPREVPSATGSARREDTSS